MKSGRMWRSNQLTTILRVLLVSDCISLPRVLLWEMGVPMLTLLIGSNLKASSYPTEHGVVAV